MKNSKVVELYLIDGNMDGFTVGEISNWNGKIVRIPRLELKNCKREDIKSPSVYLLFNSDDKNNDIVYIGESENGYLGLTNQISDFEQGKDDYYWETALLIIGGEYLNKSLASYMVRVLVDAIRESDVVNVVEIDTGNDVIKESLMASMDVFIENVKILINYMGYNIFRPLCKREDLSGKVLICKNRNGGYGLGLMHMDGFMVLKGSRIAYFNSSLVSDNYDTTRKMLMVTGVVNKDYEFTRNYKFKTSSLAASIILGVDSVGINTWMNREGKTLKDIIMSIV